MKAPDLLLSGLVLITTPVQGKLIVTDSAS